MLAAFVLAGALASCGDSKSAGAPPRRYDGYLKLVKEAPDSPVLEFEVDSGKCDVHDPDPRLEDVRAVETAQSVTVSFRIANPERRPKPGGGCGGVGWTMKTSVTLQAPLGERRVIDASCDPPATVYRPGELRDACAPTELELAQRTAVGVWKRFDPGPLSPRSAPHAVWTGTEMVVVGGLAVYERERLVDGAAYNPSTDTWRPIASLPAGRGVHTVAWTAAGLVAVTQPAPDEGVYPGDRLHVYDAAFGAWRDAAPPPHAFDYAAASWTGREVLVWSYNGGALYHPSTDSWRAMPPAQVGAAKAIHGGAWVDEPGRLVVPASESNKTRLLVYDPQRNAWRKASKAPKGLTGFGGILAIDSTILLPSLKTVAYDVARDTWRAFDNAPRDRDDQTTYFNGVAVGGNRVVVRTGSNARPLAMLDFGTGKWSHAASPTPIKPDPYMGSGQLPAADAAVISTGRDVLLWGQNSPVGPGDPNRAWRWTPPKA